MIDAETTGSAEETAADATPSADRHHDRIFLVVVDDSVEMQLALRFACGRARSTHGRVALLYIIEPADFQHWAGVGKLMEEEAREVAEQVLQDLSSKVVEWSGAMPILHVREGSRRETVLKLIDEEPAISVLVLGAATGPKGPGPLVATLTGKLVGKLRVPVTIVPGNLEPDAIDGMV